MTRKGVSIGAVNGHYASSEGVGVLAIYEYILPLQGGGIEAVDGH